MFRRATLGIATLEELAREICEAAAVGLSRLGIRARYRPRNDIEVDGRKISGTGGFFDGDTIFYQGTVLVDLDPRPMLAALRVPQAKLARRGLDSAARRVTSLRELLGKAPPLEAVQEALLYGFAARLGIAPRWGAIAPEEESLADRLHDEEIGSDAFVAEIDDPGAADDVRCGHHEGAGGSISAYLRLEGARGPHPRGAHHRRLLRDAAARGAGPGGGAARRGARGARRGRGILRLCASRAPYRVARRLRGGPGGRDRS